MPYYGLTETELQNTTQSLPLPVGSVVGFFSTSLPTGFIICDGRTIQSTAPLDPDYYPQLVEHLDPGQTTATVPDLRGTFLRGYSIDSSVDPDGPRSPGDTQTDANKAHTHNVAWRYVANLASGGGGAGADGGGGLIYNIGTTNQNPAGATEARPKNTAVVWGIKASDNVISSTLYSETDPNTLFASVTRSLKSQFDARLSISNTDALATGTGNNLYLVPFNGETIWLYNISKDLWEPFNISGSPPSLTLSGLTPYLPYDVFVFNNGGTPTLQTTAWTNASTRATNLVKQDGIYVKSGEVNKRFVGTFYGVNASTVQIDKGLTDVSYSGGYSTDILHIGLSNHYNKQTTTATKMDLDIGVNLQNNGLIYTTTVATSAQLMYNAVNPNYSKFECASTGLGEDTFSYTITGNIFNGSTNPAMLSFIVDDYSWVYSTDTDPEIKNSLLVVSTTAIAGTYTLKAMVQPAKGYNTYAAKGIRFAANIVAISNQTISLTGRF